LKIAYLDTIGGIAGDMTLGAFISAGVSLDDLSKELRKLPVGPFELSGSHVVRHGIDAVHIDVMVPPSHHHHRHLKDITEIIDTSGISGRAKEQATGIFRILAEAEARIHATTPEKIHFHEVGAIDAIVDIVGTALCLDMLGIGEVFTSPVKTGNGGTVRATHGVLPVPTPATMEILRGYPVTLTDIPHELTTPTGAAIVRGLSSGMLDAQSIMVESIGYGAGSAEFDTIPNVLRVLVGSLSPAVGRDDVMVVETNIDDMNTEIYPYILEKLLASGALDAYLTPVIMKKGRPGLLLTALVGHAQLDTIVRCIHTETSTIGVRISPCSRRKLPRTETTIRTSFGPVRVKLVLRNGVETVVPEFEECRRIAEGRGLPLIDVYRIVEREGNQEHRQSPSPSK